MTVHVPPLRKQFAEGLNEPVEVPAELKVRRPVGVAAVPDVEVSFTFAVHDDPPLTVTDEGAQLTEVEVVRAVTVRVNDRLPSLMLNPCVLSPL